jgi:hypothetical protein
MMRLDRRPAAALALALAAALLAIFPVAAADPVDFGTPSADSAYGQKLEFVQPVDLPAVPTRVEILLRTPGAAGPSVVEVPPPSRAGSQDLTFEVVLSDGHIVPNTAFTARWRVTDRDGVVSLGPEIRHVYVDDRVSWRTLEGDIVRVHWYEGGEDFGRRALEIGENAVGETATLLGVTETEPIDFYVYADQETFYGALGPATRENVGGQAHPEIRTLFALIAPGDIDDSWVEVVIPHELVHLVFATAIDNPYHAPPHWLNEGLATYLSQGYTASDRDAVERVAADGTVIPLEGLVGAFPTTRDRFFLAYSESVSAVDHIVATFGRDALVGLIRSYATGVTDDEAFRAALGVDMAGFETDWLRSVGAGAPVRHGPQAAPPGPVPEGWSGAAPVPSVEPGGSAGATSAPISPSPGGAADVPVVPVLVGGLVVIAVVIGLLVAVGRRERELATPGGWGPTARREVVDGTFADAPTVAAPPAEVTAAEVPPAAPGDADGPSADRPTP